ncbi:hypothetical protein [Klebsiella pneumoniae]|uniref:hypothetical protein n=1 Tax=Klebsiella pneumoniae TaxID=573 RepID=UPI003A5989BA
MPSEFDLSAFYTPRKPPRGDGATLGDGRLSWKIGICGGWAAFSVTSRLLHKPSTQIGDFHVATHFNDDFNALYWRQTFKMYGELRDELGDGFFLCGRGETQGRQRLRLSAVVSMSVTVMPIASRPSGRRKPSETVGAEIPDLSTVR